MSAVLGFIVGFWAIATVAGTAMLLLAQIFDTFRAKK